MRYQKVYVQLIVLFKKEGGLVPKELIWTDGQRYSIDKVLYIDKAPSKVGGLLTVRYTVLIGSNERKIYYEKESQRWFVEKKVK